MEKSVEIKNLVVKYGNFTAVKGIDLEIEKGELFALLGENGAGKTTTVKVLCSLVDYFSGSVKIYGKELKDNRESVKRLINLSPQETAVSVNLTVRENLLLVAKLYGLDFPKKRAEEFIEKFSLGEYADKRAKTLSGGTQRKLSLAMALITEPNILFLDEPTLGLDVRARRELWAEINKLKGKITVILTTHYMEEAESLSDRIAILKEGEVLTVGTAEEIKRQTGKDNIEEAFLSVIGAKI